MRKLLFYATSVIFASSWITSCTDNDSWDEYEQWRKVNNEWYNEQLNRVNPDGTRYYSLLQPEWYSQSGVLIHYFNDRSLTANNLQPMLTSTVSVKYHGRLYNDVGFDSTTVGSDSVRTFQLTGVIAGWQIALTQMHVGDSVEIIVPYAQGYGYSGSGASIPPYSTLKFNIGLKDIPGYEIRD